MARFLFLALAALPGCSRCGPERIVLDATGAQEPDDGEPVTGGDEEERRLPKHDWNGLTVMMREAQVREALGGVGFKVVPSRLDVFPILDLEGRRIRWIDIQGFTPPIVALETEKTDSPLSSVYGVTLFFHRNRLYAFRPVYHADPVDLVEPGDTAVPPDVMEKRLLGTFGEPVWSGKGEARTSVECSMLAWEDKDLQVIYALEDLERPPRYGLYFFSPRGNELVGKLVDKLLRKGPPRPDP